MTLEGRPQGKGRPRYTVRAGRAFAYTPASTRAYESSIRQAWMTLRPKSTRCSWIIPRAAKAETGACR